MSAEMSGACRQNRTAAVTMIALALLAGGLLIASRLLLKQDLSEAAKFGAALMPVLPFLAMFVVMARAARSMDEMFRRIQVEALSITFLVTSTLLIGWGQLQKAGFMPMEDVASVWPLMVFVYIACFFAVMRRYK